MNGIEKITQRIASEAQAEIDRILGDARDEADRIAESYRAQADGEAAELNARNEKNAAEREERLVSAAQMEARKVLLAAKQEMVEKAYIQALDKLCAMPEEQYVSVLAGLLVKASTERKRPCSPRKTVSGSARLPWPRPMNFPASSFACLKRPSPSGAASS